MKLRWLLVIAVVILLAITLEILKTLGYGLEDYFGKSVYYIILVPIFAKAYEILWDFIKDDIKDFFRKRNNKSEENKKIAEEYKPEIDLSIHQLKTIMLKKCVQYIDSFEDSEIKYIKQLNWRFRKSENRYEFKSGSLFNVVDNHEPKGTCGLIVIGYPGVGKTSAVYTYIHKLITECPTHKIPVYFPLCLWTRDQSLTDWMSKELEKNYNLKGKFFRYLIDTKGFMPVFDALDQVDIELRFKCIERIINYAEGNPIMLTCRPDEFKAIDVHFRKKEILLSDPFSIFELRPLKSEQVQTVLNSLHNTDVIRKMIASNPKFSEIVTYPMLLYIIVTIRNQIKLEDLEFVAKQNNVYEILWQKYDEYIFTKEGIKSTVRQSSQKKISYPEEQTRFWLHRIAKQEKTVIFIEDLQPKYLDNKRDRFIYYFFSRIACIMFLSIGIGLFLSGPFDYLGAGIIAGCIVAFLTLISRRFVFRKNHFEGLPGKSSALATILIYYLASVVGLVLYFGFSSPRKKADMRFFESFAITEANVGLFMALFVGVIFGLREYWYHKNDSKEEKDVKPVEKISINWPQFIRFGLVGGLLLGFFLAVCASIFVGFFPDGTFSSWVHTIHLFPGSRLYQWTNGLIDIFVLGIMAGMAFGFPLIGSLGILNLNDVAAKIDEKKQIDRPNYGIRQSLRNLLRGSIPAGVIMVIMYGAFFGTLTNDYTCFLKGIKSGLGGSIIVALWFGGFDVIQHFILRTVIYFREYGPWNFVKFLKFATRLRFVKPAGSSYEFIHDTLFSYFRDNYEDKRVVKNQWPFFVLLWALFLLSIVMLIIRRTDPRYFWKNTDGFVYEYVSPDLIPTKAYSKWLARRSGVLRIQASGSIYAGSFSGYVHPEGTRGGFLGFPIGVAYNIHRGASDRHSALMVRTSSTKEWASFYKDSPIWNPYADRELTLPIVKGDTVHFIVNDSEHQNNSGKYKINMAFIDEPKLIIGHRGASGEAPENSLSAIKKAMSNNLNLIEFDLRMTKDNQLVVMHDKDINRTTSGKGLVRELTYNEIKKFSLLSSVADSTFQEKVPTLLEILTAVKDSNVKLLIDIKDPDSSPDFARILFETLVKVEMINRVEVFSFDKEFLKNLKRLHPKIRTGLFVLGPIDYKETYGVDIIGIHYFNLYLFPNFINNLHQKKYKIYLWTVNSASAIKLATQANIDGIISDFPNRVKEQLIINK